MSRLSLSFEGGYGGVCKDLPAAVRVPREGVSIQEVALQTNPVFAGMNRIEVPGC